MKLGIEDVSISYQVAQPVEKKKFVRRAMSVAMDSGSHHQSTPTKRSHSVGHTSRMSVKNRPPMIGIGNNNKNTNNNNEKNKDKTNNSSERPASAVRFQDGGGSKAITPNRRRPPQSPTPSAQRAIQVPESPIHGRPVTPNKQVKTYGEEPRFPITTFRQEYQSTTHIGIPTITRVRKELILKEVAVPWNSSCNPPDRETLRVQEDMAKNLRQQKKAISQNRGVRPGSAPAGHKKTIPDSFSRNRNSRTSGPILNLPYRELRRNCPPIEKNIHDKRWNIQTKDRDDDERAKPEGGQDTSLHAMYMKENAYYRRNRPTTGGAIAITKTDDMSGVFR